MSEDGQINSSKRNYQEFLAQNLQGKLRSKEDFYAYLDRHRKYIPKDH